ncbi:enolase C-terminal domain-like protein [Magnetovibrio blakemorei]|uniref:Mandelate racemase/muconate lactonizing enzyme C-terminal domain-containing protein n=1 Tax=Magnetovibrio blakemorei TaxID=28181 RepID=A0A1E5QC83_9PROT|nr:enolase C-terminal domain-like protein [Magnetovibrio blakemorei]OEJ69667.1 hypothetical protein BEN30_02200 [Magnetovibrio blakemorei]
MLTVIPYSLPLLRPWTTARGVLHTRQGWLVRVGDAWGDCAPMVEAGTESHAQAWAALTSWDGGTTEELPAAARCAIESVRLPHRFGGAGTVRVNAALGAIDDALAASIADAADAGFQIVKLKLGVRPWAEELTALEALSLPEGMSLRLDVNEAWTMAQASDAVQRLRPLAIDCIEDPLTDPSCDALAALQAQTSIPLAADACLSRLGVDALIAAKAVRRLILKPMVQGGPDRCVAIAARAKAEGIACIVTTVVESACGVWLAARTAAEIDPSAEQTHGLDTSRWLCEDTGQPPPIVRGRIALGGGFVPFDEFLQSPAIRLAKPI